MNQNTEINEVAKRKEVLRDIIHFAELRIKELQDSINLVDKYTLLYLFTAFTLMGSLIQKEVFDETFFIFVLYAGMIALAIFAGIITTKKFDLRANFIEEINKENLSVNETQEKILNVYEKEIARLEKVRRKKIKYIGVAMWFINIIVITGYMSLVYE